MIGSKRNRCHVGDLWSLARQCILFAAGFMLWASVTIFKNNVIDASLFSSLPENEELSTASYMKSMTQKRLRVIPGTGIFTDGEGMTFLFHGINLVYKYGKAEVITQEVLDFLIQHGFNSVRLGFLWYKVETSPGIYNTTYLNELREDIDLLWSKGIRVLLDLHQDCYSSYFCVSYDCLPDFITHPPNSTDFYQGGSKAFPLPVLEPQYDTYNPEDPWGRINNCPELRNGILGWSSCYITYAMGKSTQLLYDNEEGLMDHFAQFWAYIAEYFKGHPGIVGYELLNEPWLGDAPLEAKDFLSVVNPKHWDLWSEGVADRKNLQNLYEHLQQAIRSVDPEAVIFFEPATGGNLLDAMPVGFTSGPGGSDYDVKGYNVMSYHVYCPWDQKDVPGANNTHSSIQNWIRHNVEKACHPLNNIQFYIRKNDINKLHVGGWLTEFGDVPQDDRAYDAIDYVLTKMDEYLQSWSYWGDTYHNDKITYDIAHRMLVRPYPMMTWGSPTSLKYDNSTMVMTYQYRTGWEESDTNTTAIFLPPESAQLAHNWGWIVDPFNMFETQFDAEYHMLLIQPIDGSALNQDVTVKVLPKVGSLNDK